MQTMIATEPQNAQSTICTTATESRAIRRSRDEHLGDHPLLSLRELGRTPSRCVMKSMNPSLSSRGALSLPKGDVAIHLKFSVDCRSRQASFRNDKLSMFIGRRAKRMQASLVVAATAALAVRWMERRPRCRPLFRKAGRRGGRLSVRNQRKTKSLLHGWLRGF